MPNDKFKTQLPGWCEEFGMFYTHIDEKCEHGSLRRSCEICERDEQIKELEAEVATLTAKRNRLREALNDIIDFRYHAGYMEEIARTALKEEE